MSQILKRLVPVPVLILLFYNPLCTLYTIMRHFLLGSRAVLEPKKLDTDPKLFDRWYTDAATDTSVGFLSGIFSPDRDDF
jgi:hypothetical protein